MLRVGSQPDWTTHGGFAQFQPGKIKFVNPDWTTHGGFAWYQPGKIKFVNPDSSATGRPGPTRAEGAVTG